MSGTRHSTAEPSQERDSELPEDDESLLVDPSAPTPSPIGPPPGASFRHQPQPVAPPSALLGQRRGAPQRSRRGQQLGAPRFHRGLRQGAQGIALWPPAPTACASPRLHMHAHHAVQLCKQTPGTWWHIPGTRYQGIRYQGINMQHSHKH